MARILVACYSRGGSTAQMADLIARAAAQVEGAEVDNRPVAQLTADDLLGYDALILGSPVYYGGPAAELKRLLDVTVVHQGKLSGKVGGAFASAEGYGEGYETTVMDLLHAMLIHGMVIPGEATGHHYGAISVGPPDERGAAECEKLGRRVAQLAVRLFG